eukprot:jgi/Mesvir1/12662/Mv02211-RA.1
MSYHTDCRKVTHAKQQGHWRVQNATAFTCASLLRTGGNAGVACRHRHRPCKMASVVSPARLAAPASITGRLDVRPLSGSAHAQHQKNANKVRLAVAPAFVSQRDCSSNYLSAFHDRFSRHLSKRLHPISGGRRNGAVLNARAESIAEARAGAAEPATATEMASPTDFPGYDTEFSTDISDEECLSVVVVGASGDLARKKIFPALFTLYYEGYMPKNFKIYGFARSKMSDEEFRNLIMSTLTCRITLPPGERQKCSGKTEEFIQQCFYHAGGYGSDEAFQTLGAAMKKNEGKLKGNRVFYLAIPPNVFLDVARCSSAHASSKTGFTRVIIEKPFGRDLASSNQMSSELYKYLSEDQIYRIDHYLGKELIENLTVLRFSNLVFEPLWSRQYIRNVQIIFSENFGTEGRGGYFDSYGIIRDIMQNHLTQVLALFAMEPPVSLAAEDIRNEKVKVLRSMRTITVDDVVLGQYKAATSAAGTKLPGYLDDDTVKKGSLTPTFACIAMFIDNARWDGVPFLMKAGKALNNRRAEIRIQFRHVPGNLYKSRFSDIDRATNELVIRIQPEEAIYLKINNKVPGLGMQLDRMNLDLKYHSSFGDKHIPDSYERLILDVFKGDKRLFIRNDELEESWKVFTPLLDKLEETRMQPELYPYGSRGPIGTYYLASKYNVRFGDQD